MLMDPTKARSLMYTPHLDSGSARSNSTIYNEKKENTNATSGYCFLESVRAIIGELALREPKFNYYDTSSIRALYAVIRRNELRRAWKLFETGSPAQFYLLPRVITSFRNDCSYSCAIELCTMHRTYNLACDNTRNLSKGPQVHGCSEFRKRARAG